MTGFSSPLAPLGEALERVERIFAVDAASTYPTLGVRSFGAGCFAGPDLEGSATRYERLLQVRTGDVVYPKLMAWEGAFALVPAELDCRFVSPEFCTFVARPDRALAPYVAYALRAPSILERVAGKSAGTNVRRRRLYPDDFLVKEIPLPPISEQRVFVEHLDFVSQRVRAVRSRLTRLVTISEAITASITSRPDLDEGAKRRQGWTRVAFGELVAQVMDHETVDPTQTYRIAGVYSFGRGLFDRGYLAGGATSYTHLTRLVAGNIVMSRLKAWEGALALVTPAFDGSYASPEFPEFVVDPSVALPEFVGAVVTGRPFWETLGARAKGIGARRERVSAERLLAHEVWIPPLSIQHEALAQIDLVTRSSTQRERIGTVIDALESSSLNAVFARTPELGQEQPAGGAHR